MLLSQCGSFINTAKMQFVTFLIVFVLLWLLIVFSSSFFIFYGGTFIYFYWYLDYEWQMAYTITKERITREWLLTVMQFSSHVTVHFIVSTSFYKESFLRLKSYYVPEDLTIEGYIGDYEM